MKSIRYALFSFGLVAQLAIAGLVAPVYHLQSLSQVVLQDIAKHRSVYQQDRHQLVKMVETKLMPHVAMDLLAKQVVGRHYWQQATQTQQQQFKTYFVRMVVNVYATALTSYDQQTVTFLPIRRFNPNQKLATVHCLLEPKTQQRPIKVVYQMIKQQSDWRILDFSVDGVSLTQSYHSQFQGVLAQGGMRLLLEKLKQRTPS